MKYRVHVYATFRIPVEVEADDHQDAIAKARKSCDPQQYSRWDEFDYADEITAFLVDEEGDEEERRNSRCYDVHGNPAEL